MRTKLLLANLFLACSALTWAQTRMASSAAEPVDYRKAFAFVQGQLEKLCQNPNQWPNHTEGGKWQFSNGTGWMSGYFPGMLWMVYGRTNDPVWLDRARRWTEPIKVDRIGVNYGVVFMPSYVAGYRLTGNQSYRKAGLDAAQALSRRYLPGGKYNRWKGNVGDPEGQDFLLIDLLIDLNLLYWAAEETRNASFSDIATNHALTTVRTALREDGSTAQVIEIDHNTGRKMREGIKQGVSPQSCWTRGQGFAIYSLAEIYQHTRNERILDAAQKMADYWIANVPDDYVPYWDFQAPQIPNEPRDSSAASLAAGGLWELAAAVKDSSRSKRYRKVAIATLDSLTRRYTAKRDEAADGRILCHATYWKSQRLGVDESLILGDYYYLELLLKAMK